MKRHSLATLVCAGLLVAGSGFEAQAADAREVETILEDDSVFSTRASIAAIDDDTATLLYRGFVETPAGRRSASFVREFDAGRWSEPMSLGLDFPTYPSSYGPDLKSVFDQQVVVVPARVDEPARTVAAVTGNYSTSQLNAEGILGAVFFKVFEDGRWGDWTRVTPVGITGDMRLAVDAAGIVWYAWRTSTNLDAGEILVASFNPATGETTAPEAIAEAPQRLAFNGISISPSPAGLYVTYRSPEGIDTRLRDRDGAWGAPIVVTATEFAPPLSTAYWQDTLWVALDNSGISLLRLEGDTFEIETPSVFEGFDIETDEIIESRYFRMPSLVKLADGRLGIAANEDYYFERQVAPFDDDFSSQLVMRARSRKGNLSKPIVLNPDNGWNVGRAIVSTDRALWVAGTGAAELFVVRKGDPIETPTDAVEDVVDGMLNFLNDPQTDLSVLDEEVGLDVDAALGLISVRSGDDGILGTVDDQPFADLRQAYDAPDVGTAALRAIEDYVRVQFPVVEARVLDFLNDPSTTFDVLDVAVALPSQAADALIRYRDGGPDLVLGTADDAVRRFDRIFHTAFDVTGMSLDGVPYVGPAAIQRLIDVVGRTVEDSSAEDAAFIADAIDQIAEYSWYYTVQTEFDFAEEFVGPLNDRRGFHCDGLTAEDLGLPTDPQTVAYYGDAWSFSDAMQDQAEVIEMFVDFAAAANGRGASIDTAVLTDALDRELDGLAFASCETEFEPDPWSGIERTGFIATRPDGTTVQYLFQLYWSE